MPFEPLEKHWNLNQNMKTFVHENTFENVVGEIVIMRWREALYEILDIAIFDENW